MTDDIQPREPERSEKYTKLLEELIVNTTNMIVELNVQGMRDGLPDEVIREDTLTTFKRIGETLQIIGQKMKTGYLDRN